MSTSGAQSNDATPGYPELSPLGPDSLGPSPHTVEMVPKTADQTTIMVSDITVPLDAGSPAAARLHDAEDDVSSSYDISNANLVDEPSPLSSADHAAAHALGLVASLDDHHAHPNGRASTSAQRCVVLSKLAEGVRSSQVHDQCAKFGIVERVYMPKRKAHPVFGVAAFVLFRAPDVAAAVVAAFNEAGFEANLTDAMPPSAGTAGKRHVPPAAALRRSSIASGATGDSRGASSHSHSGNSSGKPPLTIEEIIRRGEDRRQQQQQQQPPAAR